MPNFKTAQFVNQPIERVFAFFCDPANLLLLTPPSLDLRIDKERIILPTHGNLSGNRCAITGSQFTVSMNVLPRVPIRIQWVARIVQWEMNRFFCDTQANGKVFKHWYHCHRFRAEHRPSGAGTLISDEIDFDTGKGTLVNTVALEVIKRTFAYRKRTVDELAAEGAF